MRSTNIYERKILSHERQVLWSPTSNIAICAKIRGFFTEDRFRYAVNKLQERYPLLRVKVDINQNHEAWFKSENVELIPIKIIERNTEEQWICEFLKEHKKAFKLDKGPLIKILLIKSREVSDLIIICHHIICDGKCLPTFVRDILFFIENQTHKLPTPQNSPLLIQENIPKDAEKNYMIKPAMKIINKSWEKNEIIVTEDDYQLINKIYWDCNNYRIIVKELTKKETSNLIILCRQNNVTVTSGLCVAIIKEYQEIKNKKKQKIDISVDLRKFLNKHAKEAIGYYVGKINFISKYNKREKFWDNTRSFHKKLSNKLNKNKGFEWILQYNNIYPTLIDATPFILTKDIGYSEYKKHKNLSKFFENKNIAISLIDKSKFRASNLLFANIGKIDYPSDYGNLELERLIPLPSASRFLDLIIGIETIGGKMTITFNYIEETIDTPTVKKIISRALKSLEINNQLL